MDTAPSMPGSSWPSPPLRRGCHRSSRGPGSADRRVGRAWTRRKRTPGYAIRRPAGVHNTCSLVMPSPSERRLMIQIDIEVPDRPGELAKLAAILGTAGINIEAISGESASGRSYVSLIVSQPVQAREALMKHGYVCSTRTVLVVRLDDKPGALAALAKKLGDAGVNVMSAIHLGTVGGHAQLALGVDNLEKARSLV
ncbi:MAG: ACT domain-containing protein [Methanobacteriota archaeon]|nr:MAG: ACT domain-containing protein [Euryarchaeota archaeon]